MRGTGRHGKNRCLSSVNTSVSVLTRSCVSVNVSPPRRVSCAGIVTSAVSSMSQSGGASCCARSIM